MSRLNLGFAALSRAAAPSPALNTFRSQLAAQRSLYARIQHQASSLLRAPGRGVHTSFRPGPAFRDAPRRGFRTSARRGAKEGSGSGSGSGPGAAAEEGLSFGARMKKLTKEYGWVTMGVYLGLSAADFPFCFLLVRVAGPDRIGDLEHKVTSVVGRVVPDLIQNAYNSTRDAMKGLSSRGETEEGDDFGVKQAQEATKNSASLVTQLALAYAIHKSLIFLRVPLTAAVTPKVVKILRSWGWQIGKKTPKA